MFPQIAPLSWIKLQEIQPLSKVFEGQIVSVVLLLD